MRARVLESEVVSYQRSPNQNHYGWSSHCGTYLIEYPRYYIPRFLHQFSLNIPPHHCFLAPLHLAVGLPSDTLTLSPPSLSPSLYLFVSHSLSVCLYISLPMFISRSRSQAAAAKRAEERAAAERERAKAEAIARAASAKVYQV